MKLTTTVYFICRGLVGLACGVALFTMTEGRSLAQSGQVSSKKVRAEIARLRSLGEPPPNAIVDQSAKLAHCHGPSLAAGCVDRTLPQWRESAAKCFLSSRTAWFNGMTMPKGLHISAGRNTKLPHGRERVDYVVTYFGVEIGENPESLFSLEFRGDQIIDFTGKIPWPFPSSAWTGTYTPAGSPYALHTYVDADTGSLRQLVPSTTDTELLVVDAARGTIVDILPTSLHTLVDENTTISPYINAAQFPSGMPITAVTTFDRGSDDGSGNCTYFLNAGSGNKDFTTDAGDGGNSNDSYSSPESVVAPCVNPSQVFNAADADIYNAYFWTNDVAEAWKDPFSGIFLSNGVERFPFVRPEEVRVVVQNVSSGTNATAYAIGHWLYNDYRIVLPQSTNSPQLLRTMAHEMGHIAQFYYRKWPTSNFHQRSTAEGSADFISLMYQFMRDRRSVAYDALLVSQDTSFLSGRPYRTEQHYDRGQAHRSTPDIASDWSQNMYRAPYYIPWSQTGRCGRFWTRQWENDEANSGGNPHNCGSIIGMVYWQLLFNSSTIDYGDRVNGLNNGQPIISGATIDTEQLANEAFFYALSTASSSAMPIFFAKVEQYYDDVQIAGNISASDNQRVKLLLESHCLGSNYGCSPAYSTRGLTLEYSETRKPSFADGPHDARRTLGLWVNIQDVYRRVLDSEIVRDVEEEFLAVEAGGAFGGATIQEHYTGGPDYVTVSAPGEGFQYSNVTFPSDGYYEVWAQISSLLKPDVETNIYESSNLLTPVASQTWELETYSPFIPNNYPWAFKRLIGDFFTAGSYKIVLTTNDDSFDLDYVVVRKRKCVGALDNDGDGVCNEWDVCTYTDDAKDDPDNDKVCGSADNCPNSYNPGQQNIDGDSKGDVCDPCIDDATATGPDGPPAEAHPDGYCTTDNCPSEVNPDQYDRDSDGIGDACDSDIDGDGYVNTDDNCILIANSGQSDVDGDGVGDACDPCDNTQPIQSCVKQFDVLQMTRLSINMSVIAQVLVDESFLEPFGFTQYEWDDYIGCYAHVCDYTWTADDYTRIENYFGDFDIEEVTEEVVAGAIMEDEAFHEARYDDVLAWVVEQMPQGATGRYR